MPHPLLGVFLGMERVMKILVIDDTQVHLDAAKQTLVGHDVTYCETHEEAVDLLSVRYDKEGTKKLLVSQGFPESYHSVNRNDEKAWRAWWKAHDQAEADSKIPYWDVVLTDLLMPAGSMAQGDEGQKFVGQEMAIGWALALRAARTGAKYVAVVTDTNHHHHPASAMLDAFNRHFFTIDGARVLMTNYVNLVGIAGTDSLCGECGGTGKRGQYSCHRCDIPGRVFAKKGKDWGSILEQLLKGHDEYQN